MDLLHVAALLIVCRHCSAKCRKGKVKLNDNLCDMYVQYWRCDPREDDVSNLPRVLCGTCNNHLRLCASGKPPSTIRPQFEFKTTLHKKPGEKGCGCDVCRAAYSPTNRRTDRYALGFAPATRPARSDSEKEANRRASIGKRKRLSPRRISPSTAHSSKRRGAADCGTFDLSDVRKLQQIGEGLSMSATDQALKILRKKIPGVPSIRSLRNDRKKRVESHFGIEKTNMGFGKKYDRSTRPTIIAKCLNPVSYLIEWLGDVARQPPLRIKFMVDFGKELLKFGVQAIDFSANSTCHQQLLAVTTAPESTENFRRVMETQNFTTLFYCHNVQYVCDIKAQCMLCGIMCGGRYPCIYCTWKPSDGVLNSGMRRTYDRSVSMFQRLRQRYGGNAKKHACDCESVEAPPLIECDDFLKTFPPPELHMLLGCVQKPYDELTALGTLSKPALLSPAERKAHMRALAKLRIKRSKYHGGSFEGNDCRKLLNNLDASGLNANERCKPIYDVLVAFNEVVKACFGKTRTDDFGDRIAEYTAAYERSGMSVTTKAHYVMHHVADYLRFFEKPGVGLGIVSEQAIESSHHHFSNLRQKFKRDEPLPVDADGIPVNADGEALTEGELEVLTNDYHRRLDAFGKSLLQNLVMYNYQRLDVQ